jgi:hypothetical protein
MTSRRSRRQAARAHQDAVLRGAPSGSEAVDRLLAQASAPAHADEVVGLAAAVTMFAQITPRRNPVLSTLAKLLAAKAIAIGGAAALGGVAVAAAAGALPAPVQDFAHDAVRAPAAESSTHPAPAVQELPTSSSSPSASPSPNLIGLCRAYDAGVADANGKALSNPAFTALVIAAGGQEGVASYCTTVLAAAPDRKPTALPSQAQSHKPSSHPTGAPSTHPTGAPSTHPTAAPSTHP